MTQPLIQICLTCPRARLDLGVMRCRLDGRSVHLHAREKDCPEGRFRQGLGDTIARALSATGVSAVVKAAGGCGGAGPPCTKRRKRLNRIAPSL